MGELRGTRTFNASVRSPDRPLPAEELDVAPAVEAARADLAVARVIEVDALGAQQG